MFTNNETARRCAPIMEEIEGHPYQANIGGYDLGSFTPGSGDAQCKEGRVYQGVGINPSVEDRQQANRCAQHLNWQAQQEGRADKYEVREVKGEFYGKNLQVSKATSVAPALPQSRGK